MNRLSLNVIFSLVILCIADPKARAQQPFGATFGSIIGLGGTPSDIVLDELIVKLWRVFLFRTLCCVVIDPKLRMVKQHQVRHSLHGQ